MNKRKCAICKKPAFLQRGLKAFCSPECGAELALQLLEKGKLKREKADAKVNRKAKREFDRHDLTWQHKTCKTAFNKSRVIEELYWFRSRGIEPYCISCGKTNMDWCCGHFKTVGSSGNLRYDRQNTFLQCNRYCNMALSGNINGNKKTRGYIEGIRYRFGDTEGKKIVTRATLAQYETKKWTWQEVEAIKFESLEIQKRLS
jgi:hypothetical protein